MEEKALANALRHLRTQPAPADGPLVSIVVTNRDGESHLRRLLAGLSDMTRYQSIEVVLVDNGSKDRSTHVFEQWDGRKLLVANDSNRSFSAANNQGVRASSGELVLLANNDIEPIHPDWLGYMVQSLEDDVSAVGAMLVYPKRPVGNIPLAYPDMTVQHLGVYFEYSKWGVRAVNMGAGDDPLGVEAPSRRDVPATTAACLLARRTDLLANPFDEEYWYGSEDWDLCMRLGNLGRVVVDERAVLFHYEFGTQDRYMSETWLERRTNNHIRFNDLWGPAVKRKLREEISGPPSGWFFRGHGQPTVSVTSGSRKAEEALAERIRSQAIDDEWKVEDNESRECDLAVAVGPPANVQRFVGRDTSVALVVGREQEWVQTGSLDAAKRVVAPNAVTEAKLDAIWGEGLCHVDTGLDSTEDNELFSRIVETASPPTDAMRIGISTCAPDWTRAQFWGETYLARGLMRAFRRLGHETAELISPDWRGRAASSCDAVIHLRGLTRRPIARGQWNLLWIISHPDRIEESECADYDVVASASKAHAQQLSERLGRPVHYMPQATDVDTFRIGARDVNYEAPVLYVGVGRWPPRRGPRWLMRNGRSFHLYGRNWEKFPEGQFVRGENIPNRDLAVAYRSAGVVVADHHGSMREYGFVANRIFDVFAAGGVVLSDDVNGLEDLFGDLVPVYSDPHELESQLRILLTDGALRRRISSEGRRAVLAHHTLDDRAREWLRLLSEA